MHAFFRDSIETYPSNQDVCSYSRATHLATSYLSVRMLPHVGQLQGESELHIGERHVLCIRGDIY